MIDWFVLLSPLILLPVFLLFVFVGCGLNRSGAIENMTFAKLAIGEGLFDDIEHITVTFDAHGEGISKASGDLVLNHDDIVQGAFVECPGIVATAPVAVTCTCVIVVFATPYKAFVETADIESEVWNLDVFFVLSRQAEESFTISVLSTPHIELVGGIV